MQHTTHIWSEVHLAGGAVLHVRIPVRVVVVSAADVLLGGAA